MRIGIVCPYSFEVPGGVQGHVLDLAKALRERGHEVDVLAPADEDTPLPDFVRPAYRNRFDAAYRSNSLGFRLVRELKKP